MEVDVAENSDMEETGVKRHGGQGSGVWKEGWRESPAWMKPLPSASLSSLPICLLLNHKVKRARAPVNGCFYS